MDSRTIWDAYGNFETRNFTGLSLKDLQKNKLTLHVLLIQLKRYH